MKICQVLSASVIAFLSCLLITACQQQPIPDERADLDVTRITADDIDGLASSAQLAVGTTGKQDVLLFDPSRGPLEFGKVELTCPNGQRMGMDRWLVNLAKDRQLDAEQLAAAPLSLARTRDAAGGALDNQSRPKNSYIADDDGCYHPNCYRSVCVQTCYLCTDGYWVCYCEWEYVCTYCG